METGEKKGSGPQGFIRIAGYLLIIILIVRLSTSHGSESAITMVTGIIIVFIFTEGFATVIGRLIKIVQLLEVSVNKNENKKE